MSLPRHFRLPSSPLVSSTSLFTPSLFPLATSTCSALSFHRRNKSDGVQTSDAFWRSARVHVFELSLKWYGFMFLVLLCFILVVIPIFSEIQLVCDRRTDRRTDGRTYPLIEMRERIQKWLGSVNATYRKTKRQAIKNILGDLLVLLLVRRSTS